MRDDDVRDPGSPDAGVVAGLYWGVRDSFVRYVLMNPDGGVYGDDGVETDGDATFRFPLRRASHSGGRWRIEFGGELSFVAHAGLLAVRISRPVVEIGRDQGALSVSFGEERAIIARLAPAEAALIDGGWVVFPPLPAELTAAGVGLFGDVYSAGEPLDPLRIALPADVPGAIGAARAAGGAA
ncbi:HtaA domain-containing protein [Microbacterium sp. JZ31]|uniref:HtaA domain-containing protein n=1 Tax=Microbacterium sp. JZ31 TaxID=1906274 RepID=UPI001931FE99|nr:HtaA domain-containing protein [Microbacterium sp. JZ31]